MPRLTEPAKLRAAERADRARKLARLERLAAKVPRKEVLQWSDERGARLLDAVDDLYAEGISVTEMARHVGIDPRVLHSQLSRRHERTT